MVRVRPGSYQRQLQAVFTSGTVAGLTDAELLDRFLGRRDDGASFEALVARHRPMVLGVCRDLLGDEHAADDAFQATFLVLVRKAHSVRVGDSLGRWLYGVAHRVARHARADIARRRRREGVVEAASASTASPVADAERSDLRAVLQEELAGLPASFRSAVVLCHLEGLTHEEAARQLRCPVGTVRSRLARGRDRLRDRLVRRGVAPAAALVAMEESSRASVPAVLAVSTAGAAAQFAGGAGVGAISVSVLTLTKGVVLSMTLGPIKVAATGLMAVGLISVAATGVVAQQGKTTAVPSAKPERSPSLATKSLQPASADLKGDAEEKRTRTRSLLDAVTALKADFNKDVDDASVLFFRGQVDAAQAVLKSILEKAQRVATGESDQTTPPPAVPNQEFKRQYRPTDPFSPRPPTVDPTRPDEAEVSPARLSSQELISEYRNAQLPDRLYQQLYERHAVSREELHAVRTRLDRAYNRLVGQMERDRDELELLRVRLKKQEAEVLRALGQYDGAKSKVDRSERVNQRIKGSVSAEEVAEYEAELKAASGTTKVAQAEVEMVQVQIRQVERRLAPLVKFLETETKPPARISDAIPGPPPPPAR